MNRLGVAGLVLALLLGVVARLSAHGTELLGGEAGPGPAGRVELRLEIVPRMLALLAGSPEQPSTWGALRKVAPRITATLGSGLGLACAGRIMDPAEVRIAALAGAYPPADPLGLPDRVLVRVVWRDVPAPDWSIRERFHLENTLVTLVVATAATPTVPITAAGSPAGTPTDEPWWRILLTAVVVGFTHIIPGGTDHILFVLGLYAAARSGRDLLAQITAFTAAHCLTLGLAMVGVIALPPAWSALVEIAIAASIVIVALENLGRPHSPGGWRLAVIAGFGLVHGLGFAGALAEVAWPEGRFLPALLAANLGIELGQMVVVGAAAVITSRWWSHPWYRVRVVLPLSAVIGLVGGAWTLQRVLSHWAVMVG